jgi:hypothetical protein
VISRRQLTHVVRSSFATPYSIVSVLRGEDELAATLIQLGGVFVHARGTHMSGRRALERRAGALVLARDRLVVRRSVPRPRGGLLTRALVRDGGSLTRFDGALARTPASRFCSDGVVAIGAKSHRPIIPRSLMQLSNVC